MDLSPFFHAASGFAAYLYNQEEFETQQEKRRALERAYRQLDGAIPHAGILFLKDQGYYYSFHPRENNLLWFQPLSIITDGSTPPFYVPSKEASR